MKFLVCYDGTEIAKATAKKAQAHAKVWGATLEIVKIITRGEPLGHRAVGRMECELEAELIQIFGEKETPYHVELLLTESEPGEKLVEYAKDKGFDQIFLGISKRSKVGKLIFGSSAQYIILNAPCPVLSINKS
jgi:nucleotide-binding universal stress UspA family protein